MLSQGQSIEIFKGVGDPNKIAARLELAQRRGLARHRPHPHGDRVRRDHRRLASLHDRRGHLPGAQRLAVEPQPPARELIRHGERFQTENDSEVAAALSDLAHARGRHPEAGAGGARSTISTASTPSWSAPRRLRRAARSDRLQAGGHGRDRRLGRLRHGVSRARRLCPASTRRASGSRSRPPSTSGAGAPDMARKSSAARPRCRAGAQFHARPRTACRCARSTSCCTTPTAATSCIEPARAARHRRRPRRRHQRHDRRPCRLLLRRHEQAGRASSSTAMPAPASPRT